MDINSYLKKLLSSQDLLPEQNKALEAHKDEVTKFLQEEFGNEPVIRHAGSCAKGTMIRDSYDLDVVCYFPSSDERTLKEIRQDVAEHLSKKYVLDHSKASAERILDLRETDASHDYHIDVVPGRFIEGTKDVFLHVANGDKERIQTNLKKHIDYIKESGCVPVIRLVKIWNCRNNSKIRTFILELFVVNALNGSQSKSDLKKSFIKVMEAFRDDFGTTQLIDPANTNNIVSDSIDAAQAAIVAQMATSTLVKIEESDDIAAWKSVFRDESTDTDSGKTVGAAVAATAYAAGTSFKPSRPWGDSHDYGS